MRTVQEILRELDVDKLIDEYLYKDPIDYESFANKENGSWEINEVRSRCHNRIREFIERLKTLQITPPEDGHTSIFLTYNHIKDGFDEPMFDLIHLDELMGNAERIEGYAYEFQHQSEIVGYLVAETELTEHYIYELMADVLFEASFFGYEEEHLEEERQSLDKAIKEMEDIKAGKAEGRMHTIEDLLGDHFDPEDDTEKDLRQKAYEASHKYSEYSRNRELEKVKEMVVKERIWDKNEQGTV